MLQKTAVLLFSGLALCAQTIQNNAAPGVPTTVLSPMGLYDIVGDFKCQMASYENLNPANLPTALGACSVTVDGTAVGLTYASPSRITFQAPLSGSIVQVGKVSIPVSFQAATVAAYSTGVTNGVPIPVIVNGTGAVQGSRAFPITINQQIASEITVELNGVGTFTSFDTPTGPVPPGTIGYGFCDHPPVAMLDSTVLTIATEPDGSGNQHPACKELGATVAATYFLPLSPIFNTQKAHTLTIGGASYLVWVKYQAN